MKSRSAEPQPLAFQLAAALERYDAAVTRLVDTWLDCDQYMEATSELNAIKMLTPALPHLAATAVELSIAHAELVSALWEDKAAPASVRQRHDACVAALRAKALQLLRA